MWGMPISTVRTASKPALYCSRTKVRCAAMLGFSLPDSTCEHSVVIRNANVLNSYNIFILHTSASITVNENSDPDVRTDLEMTLNYIVPENLNFVHVDEGKDDMPAHVKSSLMGASLTIPISNSCLALGAWQGIYLNEHRDHGGKRSIVLTIQGMAK